MLVPNFVIIDRTWSGVDKLPEIASAITRQICEHAGYPEPIGWGFKSKVRVGFVKVPLKSSEVAVELVDATNERYQMGVHVRDVERKMPIIRVHPSIARMYKRSLSMVLSHEILEVLGDWDSTLFVKNPKDGKSYAKEICDPCASDAYAIGDVKVSDFVLPSYYMADGKYPYDHLGLIKEPFEIREGGYAQYLENKRWQLVAKSLDENDTEYMASLDKYYGRRRTAKG